MGYSTSTAGRSSPPILRTMIFASALANTARTVMRWPKDNDVAPGRRTIITPINPNTMATQRGAFAEVERAADVHGQDFAGSPFLECTGGLRLANQNGARPISDSDCITCVICMVVGEQGETGGRQFVHPERRKRISGEPRIEEDDFALACRELPTGMAQPTKTVIHFYSLRAHCFADAPTAPMSAVPSGVSTTSWSSAPGPNWGNHPTRVTNRVCK